MAAQSIGCDTPSSLLTELGTYLHPQQNLKIKLVVGEDDNNASNIFYPINCRPCGIQSMDENYDDGLRMIACDDCNTWQHTKCAHLRDDEEPPETFLCTTCAIPKVKIQLPTSKR